MTRLVCLAIVCVILCVCGYAQHNVDSAGLPLSFVQDWNETVACLEAFSKVATDDVEKTWKEFLESMRRYLQAQYVIDVGASIEGSKARGKAARDVRNRWEKFLKSDKDYKNRLMAVDRSITQLIERDLHER